MPDQPTSLATALKALTFVKKGQRLLDVATADRFNAITGALLALARGENIQRCLNIFVRRFPNGYSLTAGEGGAGGVAEERQLQIFDASEGATPKIGVTVGQFGGVVPKIGATFIDDATPPKLTVGAADTQVYIKGTAGSTGSVTLAEVLAGDVVPDNDEDFVYELIGTIVVTEDDPASVACTPLIGGSLSVELCVNVDGNLQPHYELIS